MTQPALEQPFSRKRRFKNRLRNTFTNPYNIITLIALILGELSEDFLIFITTDSVSYIFTLAILWIASRLDGILEDQVHYLERLSQETKH